MSADAARAGELEFESMIGPLVEPGLRLAFSMSFAEPGGSHIAIGVLDPAYPQTGGFAPVDLFVVGSDGIVAFERKDVTLFSQ